MNRIAVAKGARDFSWPFVAVVGGGLATLAVVGIGPGQPLAAPPKPAPTATVTAPPASTLRAKPAPSHTSTPRTEPAGGGVEAAAAPRSGGSSTAQRPGPGAPSGPAPHPPAASQPPAATTSSCDVGLSLLALNACLKLGGTR